MNDPLLLRSRRRLPHPSGGDRPRLPARPEPPDGAPRSIDPAAVPGELQRLEDALAAAQGGCGPCATRARRAAPVKVAEFIDSHLLMLEDVALVDPARALIRERLFSAEWALEYHRMSLVRAFEDMEAPYLRSRRDDVDHVVQHILGFLLGGRSSDPA